MPAPANGCTMKNNIDMKNINIKYILLAGIITLQACKKDNNSNTSDNNNTTGTIKPQVDPSPSNTQGFFMDDWAEKTFTIPASLKTGSKPAGDANVTVSVDYSNVLAKVPANVYGNNTNPYMGQFVTEPLLLNYLNDLNPHLLRFPGGGLSDLYFWNGAPGTPPADVPAQLPDANGNLQPAGYWYGNNPQTYTFTLDNYYKTLQQTNSKGVITINYGYARYGTSAHPDQAAAHLAADWVRYDKGRTRYWEIGNENYGTFETGYKIDLASNHDGQPRELTGDLYGMHFKLFADSMRKAAAEVGADIKIGAVLVETASTASNSIPDWNKGVLTQAGNTADFYIVHNYYTPYNSNSSAETILATPEPITLSIMNYVKSQASAYNAKQVPVALTEWNIQAVGSAQNVSNIAGLHAVMTLGEIIKNKFGEASRWDLANGWINGDDQGMFNNPFNSDNEPGAARWNARPAFYYMYYFQKFFGDRMVSSTVQGSTDVFGYASSFSSGEAGIVLVNRSKADQPVSIKLNNFAAGDTYYYYTLSGGNDNGDFSHKVYVNGSGPSGASGGPDNYAVIAAYTAQTNGGVKVTVPARSAVFLVISGKK